MNQDDQPPLPRPPDDAERLRRLREEALRRVEEEERKASVTVYGGPPYSGPADSRPPAPLYGSPAMMERRGSSVAMGRRWTLRGILLVILGIVAAIVGWLVLRKISAPVYGGPPPPGPR